MIFSTTNFETDRKSKPGETSSLTGNDNTTTPKRCGSCSLWNTVTHPVINPSLLVFMMLIVGFGVTALVLPNKLDCIDDDCDPSGLGPPLLYKISTGIASGLYCVFALIGLYAAKQRSDNLDKARNDLDKVRNDLNKVKNDLHEVKNIFTKSKNESLSMSFGKKGGLLVEENLGIEEESRVEITPLDISSDNKQPEGTCCPLNPLTVSFISTVGAIPCGLGKGAIILLSSAATLLAGSGYDLSDLKAGSNEMWGGLVALFVIVIFAGGLIYKNHVNTDQVISNTDQAILNTDQVTSATEPLKSEIQLLNVQIKELDNPRFFEEA